MGSKRRVSSHTRGMAAGRAPLQTDESESRSDPEQDSETGVFGVDVATGGLGVDSDTLVLLCIVGVCFVLGLC